MSVEVDLARSIEAIRLDTPPSYTFVDSAALVATMVDSLVDLPTSPPSIYVDLEGINLCREGSISILQIYVLRDKHTYLVDVHSLQRVAFDTRCRRSVKSLKAILESASIPKAFFDVRNDSDALYSHFDMKLEGVHDIQLMELASRRGYKRLLCGLSKCIEMDADMTAIAKVAWKNNKTRGLGLFAPEKGGSYEVFNQRPLPVAIAEYCAQDVQFLPKLWAQYDRRLTPAWKIRVKEVTKARVLESQSPAYVPNGRHKALAPKSWA